MAAKICARRIWLWDLDGTLVDSSRVHESAFRDAIAEIAPDLLGAFTYDGCAGAETREVMANLGASATNVDRLTRRKQQLYRSFVDDGRVMVFPGAHRLLDRLAAGGSIAYLVTGGSRSSVTRVLASCSLSFRGVQTSDDITSSKPDPAVYREACDRWDIDPDDAVVVEDSDLGVRSAVGAGLMTLQVHTSRASNGAIPVQSLDEIASLLGIADEKP